MYLLQTLSWYADKRPTLLFFYARCDGDRERERREGEFKIKLLPMKPFLVLKQLADALLLFTAVNTEDKRESWQLLVTSFYFSANHTLILPDYANKYANIYCFSGWWID